MNRVKFTTFTFLISALLMVIGPVMTAAQAPEQTNAQKEISGPHIRLNGLFGGDISVEFLDSAGNVKKKIDSYYQSKFINLEENEPIKINENVFVNKKNEKLRREIKALETLVPSYRQVRQGFPPNYVLVTESEGMDATTEFCRQTGRESDIKNTITLYDKTGNVLFQKTNLECYPVALSANSGASACLTMPVEGEDWVFTETEKDALKDKVLVFSKHGEVVREIIEPINQVGNVKISPSGNWLAYVKQLERLSIQVVLINLNTGKKVALPVTDDRTDRIVTSYEEVLDNGDLRGYEEIPQKDSSGRWGSVPRPKILYRMGP